MEFEELMRRLKDAVEHLNRKCELGEISYPEVEDVRTELQWAFDNLIRNDFSMADAHINRANARMS